MKMAKPVFRISVRNLVEFILRSGDIDNRHSVSDKEAMQKGSRIHRKIQKRMGAGYQAEVSLKWKTEYEDLIILVEGRADGIFTKDDITVIDEIKGIASDPEQMEAPVLVHKAQAMCYARMYGEMESLDQIDIQMTYVNLDTEQIHRFGESFMLEELKDWYQKLLDRYHKWVSYQLQWKELRNHSMQDLEFPFPYRDGQRQMVSSVYHAISAEKQIFIQAPTGVGKTISTIFPAVRAVGEGHGEQIFYLTAKTIARTVAEETFSFLKEKGLKFKVITLTAKEKICFQEETECNPKACPYAKGHFDRINECVYELWTSGHSYDRDSLQDQARKWQVCPFEMSLDLALWADGVICDYNYVFDPNARLKRFFGEGVSGEYIFLIDEAHNLVERGREMYSASVCKEEVLEVRKKVREKAPTLARSLDKVNRQLLSMQKECEGYQILENAGMIPLAMLRVFGELEKFMEESENQELSDQILDFYFSVRDFLNISELVDDNYVVYTENSEDGKFRLHLYCVNPAGNLNASLEKGISTVFFSATLLPMIYYRKLLSVRSDDYGIYVRSPFSKEQRCILTGVDVSSRYTRRNYSEYRRIAEYIARTVWKKKGNYMIFFPSYRLLQDVYNVYEEEFSVDWVRTVCQNPGMGEREREAFLQNFDIHDYTFAAFCIMGGIFSEGIDLIGDKLIGAVIIGTGLPQVSIRREILREYYTDKGENGFDYAYRFPGMNKVLQAAGRVIRTREDTGVILLLDERFADRKYGELFPREWDDRQSCSLATLEGKLEEFWKALDRPKN